MIDDEATEPLISSSYKLDKQTLTTLVTRYKQRTKREEIDFLDRTCHENQISALLNVNPTFGIDPSEIPERKRLYGSEPPKQGASIGTLGAILMNYYMRHLMFILIILCVFMGTIHVVRNSQVLNWVLSNSFFTVAVCFIYMISTTIIRYFSHHGEGKMLTEVTESMKTTYVYRQKKLVKVHYSELVTGDIIDFRKGMFVPADILVLESRNLTADEFKYTKSHNPRQKANLAHCKSINLSDLPPNEQVLPSPVLLTGSYILGGEGKGIVLLTGSESTGSNSLQPAYSYTGTNIQLKLEITGIAYMYMGIRAVLLFFLVLEIRYFVSALPENWAEESIEYLIYTISILTFITNEDLILILHDIIGTSIKSLLDIGILPRKFLAFDGAPFITDICIDKSQVDKEVEMVKNSLYVCATAGVKIKVVTEEAFEQTREAVITSGLITPYEEHTLVIEASEFERKIQQARESREETNGNDMGDIKVVVSCKPQDKEFIIYSLQENRSIVAFVGRTCEDVVVMSKANVSFTLGSAPDILKDSADFILIKEDFSNIVEIIKWGRNIYENGAKYFQFRAPTIISTLIITLIGGIVCRDPILKPVHLIWLLILIELSARLLLASEKPNKEIMSHKPLHNPYGSIETRNMKKHIIGQAVYQIVVVFVLLFSGEYWLPDNMLITRTQPDGTIITYNTPGHIAPGRPFSYGGDEQEYRALEEEFGASRQITLIFNTYALMVLFNIVNCRTLRDEINLFKGTEGNIKFVVILTLVAGIHFFIGNFTGAVFAVSPLGMTVAQWFIALGFGLGSLVLSIILRLFSAKERDPLKEPAKNVSEINSSFV